MDEGQPSNSGSGCGGDPADATFSAASEEAPVAVEIRGSDLRDLVSRINRNTAAGAVFDLCKGSFSYNGSQPLLITPTARPVQLRDVG